VALAQLNDLSLERLANERRRWGLFPVPNLHARRQLGRGVAGQLRRAARGGYRGPGPRVMHIPGGRKPARSLRFAQLQRAGQQPHAIGARRLHPAGLNVADRALAQFGPRCQLLL